MLNKQLRILALSSSRIRESAYLATAFPHITGLLGTKKLQIAFVPFAMVNGTHEEYAQNVRDGLASLPYELNLVTPGNAQDLIRSADVIMIGGGNTFKLLHDLYEHELVTLIREKVNAGTPYVGWSAGSNILAPGIFTTNDMPIVQPQSFKALNILPFQINPHYNNELPAGHRGETRDQRLEEFLTLNESENVIGLLEGTGLLVQGGEIKLVGDENAFHFYYKDYKVIKEIIPAEKAFIGFEKNRLP